MKPLGAPERSGYWSWPYDRGQCRARIREATRAEIDQGKLDKWEHLELSKLIEADMAERSQNDDSSRFREHEDVP